MSGAIPFDMRREVIAGFLAGKSRRRLSQDLHLNYRTVSVLVARYQAQGEEGLYPHYEGSVGPPMRMDALFYRSALFLKRHHPEWGAPLIRLQLEEHFGVRLSMLKAGSKSFYPGKIPSVRTLQIWFKKEGLAKRSSKLPRTEEVAPGEATRVHQIWQVDAKEKVRLSDGRRVCYLTVTDQYSGAALAARVFPLSPDQSGSGTTGESDPHRDLSAVGQAHLPESR